MTEFDEAMERALDDSANGRTVSRGSFAEFLTPEERLLWAIFGGEEAYKEWLESEDDDVE